MRSNRQRRTLLVTTATIVSASMFSTSLVASTPASSAPFSTKATSAIRVVVSTTKATVGSPVTVAAIVTGGHGSPTGQVVFTIGATSLCVATVSHGYAGCVTTNEPIGVNRVVGTYRGDVSHLPATGVSNTLLTVTASVGDLLRYYINGDPVIGNPLATGPSIDGNLDLGQEAGIYPGALIQGSPAYLTRGLIEPIPIDPSGGTLIMNQIQLSGGIPSAHVVSATESNVANAYTKLLRNTTFHKEFNGLVTADFSQVTSSDQAKLHIGASFSYAGVGNISSTLDTANSSSQSHTLFTFTQKYFSLDYTPDSRSGSSQLGAFFAPGTSVASIEACRCMSRSNPPAFIKSVTYGSELLFLANSTATSSDVAAALDAAVNYGPYGGKLSVSYHDAQVLNRTSIRVISVGLGGSENSTVFGTIGATGNAATILAALHKFIGEQLGSGAAGVPYAVPLTYSLGYLDRASIGEYPVVTQGGSKPAITQPVSSLHVDLYVNGDDKETADKVQLQIIDSNNKSLFSQPGGSSCSSEPTVYCVANGKTYSPNVNYWPSPSDHSEKIPITDGAGNQMSIPAYELAGAQFVISSPGGNSGTTWDVQITVTITTAGDGATNPPATYTLLATPIIRFYDHGGGGCDNLSDAATDTRFQFLLSAPGDHQDPCDQSFMPTTA